MCVFFGLGAWMAIGVLGIIFGIFGPSKISAWLKLRRRTLGPFLEGNGCWRLLTNTRRPQNSATVW